MLVGLITIGGPAYSDIVREKDAVEVPPAASVTLTVKVQTQATVGVPESRAPRTEGQAGWQSAAGDGPGVWGRTRAGGKALRVRYRRGSPRKRAAGINRWARENRHGDGFGCRGAHASVTSATNVVGPPTVVGVPLTTPPEESVRPAGKEPEDMLQTRGAEPPDAIRD